MNTNQEDLKLCAQELSASFGGDIEISNADYDALLEWLTARVTEMIDRDLDQLLQILYRVDVSEYRIRKALSENAPGEAPGIIAEMILQREIQKVRTRREYSSEGNDSEDDWSFEL